MQVTRLVGTAGRGQHVALVAVKQRQRHRQAHHIDPLAVFAAVLAAKADGEVGNAQGLFRTQGRFATLDLGGGQAPFSRLLDLVEQGVGAGRITGGQVGGLQLVEACQRAAGQPCQGLVSHTALGLRTTHFSLGLGQLHLGTGGFHRR
ncbi:hypothetical protein D3C77_600600 [compost metagenome]